MARPKKVNDEAVNAAMLMLSRLYPKSAIKQLLAQKFDLKARSCETVLARAREALRKEAGVTVDEVRADAMGIYRSVIRDPKATMREKLLATEGMVKLFGAARPDRIELSGPDGQPVKTETKFDLSGLTAEQLKVIREVLSKQRPGGQS